MKFRIVKDNKFDRYGIQYLYLGLFWTYVPAYGDGSGRLDAFSDLESAEEFDIKGHIQWIDSFKEENRISVVKSFNK